MTDPQRASLKDVVSQYYQPEKYLTEGEMKLIKQTFRDNPVMMNIIRKILLPTVADPSLPLEELGNDAWMSGRIWSQIPAEEAKILAVARQDAIEFILGGLIKLKVLAHEPEENDAEAEERRKKDSSK